jgi:hypothetical protein
VSASDDLGEANAPATLTTASVRLVASANGAAAFMFLTTFMFLQKAANARLGVPEGLLEPK